MGALKDTFRADLIIAMKARDEAAKANLRMVLAAFTNEEVAGDSPRELSEAEEQAIVVREVNKRKDSAEAYSQGNRPDLVAKELSEAEFLQRYLPAPLSEDQLVAIVDEQVKVAEATAGQAPSMRQMGAIVKAVNEQVAGRAQGSVVASLVKKRLLG